MKDVHTVASAERCGPGPIQCALWNWENLSGFSGFRRRSLVVAGSTDNLIPGGDNYEIENLDRICCQRVHCAGG